MLLTMCIAGTAASVCTAARWYLDRDSRRDSTHAGGRIQLTGLRNHGSAFGLLRLNSRQLAALSAALMAGALPLRRDSRVGCGLLLGGGVSNLWERVRHGSVYDYVRFPKAPEPVCRYVFNLADFAIFLGAAEILAGKGKKRR